MSILNMLLESLYTEESFQSFRIGDKVKIIKPKGSFISDIANIDGKIATIIGKRPDWNQPSKNRKAYRVRLEDEIDTSKEYIVFDDEMQLVKS